MDSYTYHTLITSINRTISTSHMTDLECSKILAIIRARAQSRLITGVEVTTLVDLGEVMAKKAARNSLNNTITSRS